MKQNENLHNSTLPTSEVVQPSLGFLEMKIV